MSNLLTLSTPSPRGNLIQLMCRDGTVDWNLAYSVINEDEYLLKHRNLDGWAIDVGAHIGAVSIAMAIDHPGVRVIALEPIPENAALLRHNIALNKLTGRIIVDERAATRPGVDSVHISYGYTAWGNHHPDYVAAHGFIGNQYRRQGGPQRSVDVRGVSLGQLLEENMIHDVCFLKIDCEGCEWDFLRDPAVSRVKTIFGEMHSGYETTEEDQRGENGHQDKWEPGCHMCTNEYDHIERLLSATHELYIDRGPEIFSALRRVDSSHAPDALRIGK